MTREMNKPDWEREWIYSERFYNVEFFGINKPILNKEIYKIPKERILDEDWKPFIDATNERYSK